MPSLHRTSSRRVRGNRGAAAVELALVFPMLLLTVFGAIEFSTLLYDQAIITNASREAARAGVMFSTPAVTTTKIQQVATNYCQNRLVTYGASATCTFPTAITTCASTGNQLSVQVSYVFNGLVLGPLLAPFIGPFTLNATTTMLCE